MDLANLAWLIRLTAAFSIAIRSALASNRFVAADPGQLPSCKIYGRTYCLQVEEYPSQQIGYLLSNNLFATASFLLTEGLPATEYESGALPSGRPHHAHLPDAQPGPSVAILNRDAQASGSLATQDLDRARIKKAFADPSLPLAAAGHDADVNSLVLSEAQKQLKHSGSIVTQVIQLDPGPSRSVFEELKSLDTQSLSSSGSIFRELFQLEKSPPALIEDNVVLLAANAPDKPKAAALLRVGSAQYEPPDQSSGLNFDSFRAADNQSGLDTDADQSFFNTQVLDQVFHQYHHPDAPSSKMDRHHLSGFRAELDHLIQSGDDTKIKSLFQNPSGFSFRTVGSLAATHPKDPAGQAKKYSEAPLPPDLSRDPLRIPFSSTSSSTVTTFSTTTTTTTTTSTSTDNGYLDPIAEEEEENNVFKIEFPNLKQVPGPTYTDLHPPTDVLSYHSIHPEDPGYYYYKPIDPSSSAAVVTISTPPFSTATVTAPSDLEQVPPAPNLPNPVSAQPTVNPLLQGESGPSQPASSYHNQTEQQPAVNETGHFHPPPAEYDFKPFISPPAEFFQLRPVLNNVFVNSHHHLSGAGGVEVSTQTPGARSASTPEPADIPSPVAEYSSEDLNNYTLPPEPAPGAGAAVPASVALRQKRRPPARSALHRVFNNLFRPANGPRRPAISGRQRRRRHADRSAVLLNAAAPEPEQSLCPSSRHLIYPMVGYSVKGQWLYIVNLIHDGVSHKQGIITEECQATKCSGVCSTQPGAQAVCEAKFVQKRLVALHPSGNELISELFWLPHSCACSIKPHTLSDNF